MPHRSKLAVLAGALVLALVPATAQAGDPKKQECNKQKQSKQKQDRKKCKKSVKSGRMTGHGHEFNVNGFSKVQWEFRNMLCAPGERLPDLKVEFGRNKFVLTAHTSGPTCTDNPLLSEGNPAAGFDTMTGQGTGTLNGVDGATIEYVFTDEGEPGRDDSADFTITAPNGGIAYSGGAIDGGNHQAHRLTGADAR
jgi:hypothetical protein